MVSLPNPRASADDIYNRRSQTHPTPCGVSTCTMARMTRIALTEVLERLVCFLLCERRFLSSTVLARSVFLSDSRTCDHRLWHNALGSCSTLCKGVTVVKCKTRLHSLRHPCAERSCKNMLNSPCGYKMKPVSNGAHHPSVAT